MGGDPSAVTPSMRAGMLDQEQREIPPVDGAVVIKVILGAVATIMSARTEVSNDAEQNPDVLAA